MRRVSNVVPHDDEIAAQAKAEGKSAGEVRDILSARHKKTETAQRHYDNPPTELPEKQQD